MSKINTGRVILGGLVAGLVFNVLEFLLNGLILGGQWASTMEQYNMPMPGAGFYVWIILWAFVAGLLLVWLYAGLRPRFGAGPKTAILAGLAVWFFWGLFRAVDYASMGMIGGGLLWAYLIWTLIELPLVSLIGAALYKEE